MPSPIARLLLTAPVAVLVTAVASLPGTADAQATAHVTGIYSDLQSNSETGDLIGEEIEIFPGPGGKDSLQAFVQIALGSAPLAALVPVKVTGTKIELSLDMGVGGTRRFSGTVDADGITGNWYSGQAPIFSRPVHLKRGRSHWQGDGPL